MSQFCSAGDKLNLAKYKKSVFTILYILALVIFGFFPFIVSVGVYVSVGPSQGKAQALSISMVFIFIFFSQPGPVPLPRINDIRNGVKRLFCSSREKNS